jgi:beta-glucanase (GH16 family)
MPHRLLCLTLLFALSCLPARAQVVDLPGPDATFHDDGGSHAMVESEDGPALQLSLGDDAQYPAVQVRPAEGVWDLSAFQGVEARVTNRSEQGLQVALRVDNPGDWRTEPWNVNGQRIAPGQTATLRVTFGQSWGNRGYALDAARVSQVVVYAEDRPGDQSLLIHEVRGFQADTAAAGSDAPASNSVTPEASGVLFAFEGADPLRRVTNEHGTIEHVQHDGEPAARVSLRGATSYPGVAFEAPDPAWNLMPYAGVEVDVTNPGDRPLRVALRVDNPGAGSAEHWNAEVTNVAAGETKTLRVRFGQSWGGPAYDLDPSRVTQALVYLERPRRDAELLVHEVRAFGTATPRDVAVVDLDTGVLFDFESPERVAQQLSDHGATPRPVDGQLELTIDGSERYPSVHLHPAGERWDLGLFESITAEITNTSDRTLRVLMRVDNPGADGNANSNTGGARVDAGETRRIRVTFGQSHGRQAASIDPSNVVNLLIMVDQPRREATLRVDNIVAHRRQWAQVPDWVGQRPPVEGDWVQTLDEDFDGDELDEDLWTPRLVWDGPLGGHLQRYREDNVFVRDGELVIRCERNPGHQWDDPSLPTRDYATGAVTTFDKWRQRYGYFEARIHRVEATGMWPAFWTMPDRGPESGLDIWGRRSTENGGMEIDIWEHLSEWGPTRYNIATHWDGYGDEHQHWGSTNIRHLPTEDGYHHYGLLWEPGLLVWYCDGREVGRWENDRILDIPSYLKFTVHTGGWATNDVDDEALPDELLVDWVRVWQLRERVEAPPEAAE